MLTFRQYVRAICLAAVPATSLCAQVPGRASHGVDVGVGYSYVHANAPAGGCGCFSMNGGNVSAAFHLSHELSITAEFQGTHADNILKSSESLTLYTYLFGARIAPERLRQKHAVPFAQIMFGGAHTISQFPYNDGGNGIAALAGGGLDIPLSHRVYVRAADVDYLYTHIANGSNNSQNSLRISSGLVFRFN